jgi:membrane protein YqaA with SNARE-associated domain
VEILNKLGQWLAERAALFGPWGIFLVSLSDSAFIPMPQGVDVLLIAQAVASPSTAYPTAALAVVGSVLGSLILYTLARRGGKLMLERKVSASGAEKLRQQMKQYGALALIPPTMIPLPLPMKLFVIAAGVFQLPRTHFVAALVFARCVRYFGEAWIAVRYGERTTALLKEHALLGFGIAVALIAVFLVAHRWSTRRVSMG